MLINLVVVVAQLQNILDLVCLEPTTHRLLANILIIRPNHSFTHAHTNKHAHTETYINIYIYMCVCVCVCDSFVMKRKRNLNVSQTNKYRENSPHKNKAGLENRIRK